MFVETITAVACAAGQCQTLEVTSTHQTVYQVKIQGPVTTSQSLTTYTYLTPVTSDTVLFQRVRPGRKTLGRLLKCKK